MKSLLIFLLFTVSCGFESYSESKVIGGSKDNFISELKLSTVGIFKNDKSQLCSGSLIAKNPNPDSSPLYFELTRKTTTWFLRTKKIKNAAEN